MGLERISIEEAEGLIKITNDLDNAKYFTITPSIDPQKASEGWESVSYYSDKKRTYQIPTNVPNAQWVYVLTNPSMPGMVKIGYTKDDPNLRVKQLNASTGVAVDFTLEWAFGCYNAIELEQEVHKHLNSFRVNTNREFFNVSVDKAKTAIKMLGKRYNSEKDV